MFLNFPCSNFKLTTVADRDRGSREFTSYILYTSTDDLTSVKQKSISSCGKYNLCKSSWCCRVNHIRCIKLVKLRALYNFLPSSKPGRIFEFLRLNYFILYFLTKSWVNKSVTICYKVLISSRKTSSRYMYVTQYVTSNNCSLSPTLCEWSASIERNKPFQPCHMLSPFSDNLLDYVPNETLYIFYRSTFLYFLYNSAFLHLHHLLHHVHCLLRSLNRIILFTHTATAAIK